MSSVPTTTQSTQDTNIDYNQGTYSKELNKYKEELRTRLNELKPKITEIRDHIKMINSFISITKSEMDALPEEYSIRRGQKMNAITRYLETVTQLRENEMRYEETAQKLIKALVDLENNKLTTYLKLNPPTNLESNDLMTVVKNIHDQFTKRVQTLAEQTKNGNNNNNGDDTNVDDNDIIGNAYNLLKQDGFIQVGSDDDIPLDTQIVDETTTSKNPNKGQ